MYGGCFCGACQKRIVQLSQDAVVHSLQLWSQHIVVKSRLFFKDGIIDKMHPEKLKFMSVHVRGNSEFGKYEPSFGRTSKPIITHMIIVVDIVSGDGVLRLDGQSGVRVGTAIVGEGGVHVRLKGKERRQEKAKLEVGVRR